jgi:hypothetical protein
MMIGLIGNDIYDRFTMEHFRLRQSMILTTSLFLLATVHYFKIYKRLKRNYYTHNS